MSDKNSPEWSFFRPEQSNNVWGDPVIWQKKARLSDIAFDFWLKANGSLHRLVREAAKQPPLNVLVVGVDVPSRSDDLKDVFKRLRSAHHKVTFEAAPLLPNYGKFQNINAVLAKHDMSQFDWLVVTDDDIDFRTPFLDVLLAVAQKADLKICMPAHKFHSIQTYRVTQRHARSLVRQTRYVECGPLTAFHRDAFSFCLPFPELRYAWGTDIEWSQRAREHNMKIGVVDACPMEHLRPVGSSYDVQAAVEEAASYLKGAGVYSTAQDLLQNVETISHFQTR